MEAYTNIQKKKRNWGFALGFFFVKNIELNQKGGDTFDYESVSG